MARASEASGFSTADTIENLSTSVAIVSVCNDAVQALDFCPIVCYTISVK